MLSDESSSDSETGRFKCQTNKDNETITHKREDNRSSGRNRNTDERFNREFGRRRDDRERYERRSRERNRYNRYSPVRRRHSRDRSRERRKESERYRPSGDYSRNKERSVSRDRRRKSRSRSYKSPMVNRNMKDEVKQMIVCQNKSTEKPSDRKTKKESTDSPNNIKRSEVYKANQEQSSKRKSDSPIAVEDDSYSNEEEIQPGSYYKMIPTVVKDKSDESSEIDSSDDEKLRAKLLNLEKELNKSKKKKHKKKHKRKSSKTDKEVGDMVTTAEVTSTTDIQEVTEQNTQSTEVSSTQKNNQKESSEEGEILSDDDLNIDPNDLRHKLKRSKGETPDKVAPKLDACGPALPPHLQNRFKRSPSDDKDAVEPSKTDKPRHIGPSIPSDLRKVLAERSPEVIKDESSDEDTGIGPLPTGAENKWSDAHQQLEERAFELKIKQLDGHTLESKDTKSREKWMLELPEGKTKFLGLEARGFRAKEGPDMSDRSSWTDTPEDKARKAAGLQKEEDASEALHREAKERHISSRDKEQEQAVRKHKKKHKREESLLEMHQKKLKKKKKKEEEEKKERRPFSRDVDLQVNRFDEAQKQSIIKKAQGLNSRFSSGEAKYL